MHAADADAQDRRRHDQLIRKSLMIAFMMVVLNELSDGPPAVSLADRNDAIQALLFNGPHEPLGVVITRRLLEDAGIHVVQTPRRARDRLVRRPSSGSARQQRVRCDDRGNLTQC